jgi:hypothetical protein
MRSSLPGSAAYDLEAGSAAILGALAANRGDLYADGDWTLRDLVEALTEAGVRADAAPSISDETLALPLDAGGDGITLADLLDMVTRQLGLRWSVETPGMVRFAPMPG